MKSLLVVLCVMVLMPCWAGKEQPITDVLRNAVKNAEVQSLALAEYTLPFDSMLPRTFEQGKVILEDSRWWTSGFFPGTLWYIYEATGNEEIKKYASDYTWRVEREKYTTDNHDVGFMIFCSFGNALRLTGDKCMEEVINTASASLCTRFRESVSCIQSWANNPKWACPVIIDNMMNLEMLMWAARKFNNEMYRRVAVDHANTTMKNHFRPDFSSYHLVSYDTITGKVQCKQTVQGYSDDSAWARGQGWALYGYTMMYRETMDTVYLNLAQNIASYLLNHPNMPSDKIPYWDFNAPNVPNALRDVSAGAIICSALIELSQYVEEGKGQHYLDVAEQQLRALASSAYTAPLHTNGNFILMHSVGALPKASEVDVPLTYADYYYMEAIIRYAKLKGISLKI